MTDTTINQLVRGRVGAQIEGPVSRCCVDTLLKWHPRMSGQLNKCIYCDAFMKSMSTSCSDAPAYRGILKETEADSTQRLELAKAFFDKRAYVNHDAVHDFVMKHIPVAKDMAIQDDGAFFSIGELPKSGTYDKSFIVPVGRGVIFVCKEAGAGAQTTGDLFSGGALNPTQGQMKDSDDKHDYKSDIGKDNLPATSETKDEEKTEKSADGEAKEEKKDEQEDEGNAELLKAFSMNLDRIIGKAK